MAGHFTMMPTDQLHDLYRTIHLNREHAQGRLRSLLRELRHDPHNEAIEDEITDQEHLVDDLKHREKIIFRLIEERGRHHLHDRTRRRESSNAHRVVEALRNVVELPPSRLGQPSRRIPDDILNHVIRPMVAKPYVEGPRTPHGTLGKGRGRPRR